MQNLLNYAKNQIPTVPLQIAASDLQQKAQKAAERLSRQLAGTDKAKQHYFAKLDIGTIPNDKLRVAVEAKMVARYGLKGPCENALEKFETWAKYAQHARYPLGDQVVQESFMNFLLAVATEGFVGEDVTGTLMGNFKGEWRGGGFGSNK